MPPIGAVSSFGQRDDPIPAGTDLLNSDAILAQITVAENDSWSQIPPGVRTGRKADEALFSALSSHAELPALHFCSQIALRSMDHRLLPRGRRLAHFDR